MDWQGSEIFVHYIWWSCQGRFGWKGRCSGGDVLYWDNRESVIWAGTEGNDAFQLESSTAHNSRYYSWYVWQVFTGSVCDIHLPVWNSSWWWVAGLLFTNFSQTDCSSAARFSISLSMAETDLISRWEWGGPVVWSDGASVTHTDEQVLHRRKSKERQEKENGFQLSC